MWRPTAVSNIWQSRLYADDYRVEDREKLELLQKVGFIITDRREVKKWQDLTENDPEVWWLDKILTKEEAKFMLPFEKKRVNIYTVDQMAKKNRISIQKAQRLCDGLCETGILEFDAITLPRDLPENTGMYTAEEGMKKAILPYAIKRKIKMIFQKK